jgi:hypothetical protein
MSLATSGAFESLSEHAHRHRDRESYYQEQNSLERLHSSPYIAESANN